MKRRSGMFRGRHIPWRSCSWISTASRRVNDTLGHSVGDLLLKSIAAKLRDLLPVTDRIARLGGDEFAILQISGRPADIVDFARGKDHRGRWSSAQYRWTRRDGGSQCRHRRCASWPNEHGELPEERRSGDVQRQIRGPRHLSDLRSANGRGRSERGAHSNATCERRLRKANSSCSTSRWSICRPRKSRPLKR